MSTEQDWKDAMKRASASNCWSLLSVLSEDGFDPTVDYDSLVPGKPRSEEIAERRKDTCPGCGINGEVTISHAVNTAVNGISQEVQTAMLLGGVSEGVFASVVQSIESYRLP